MYERDGKTEKVRSLKSDGKTGSYQLIMDICNLFNAYPVFDGNDKTVNIYALNNKGRLYEMTMGKDIESLSVTYNSDDIITRLYVEGEYGDDGYVGIDEVNPTGLTYLMNFDYYKEIGLFTDDHQEALDLYYSEMKKAIDVIRSVAGDIITKENSLNNLWGQINYVFYPISNGTITKKIVGGTVTAEQLEIAEGNEIVIIPSDKKYRTVTAGSNGSLTLTTDDLYAIKFITNGFMFKVKTGYYTKWKKRRWKVGKIMAGGEIEDDDEFLKWVYERNKNGLIVGNESIIELRNQYEDLG